MAHYFHAVAIDYDGTLTTEPRPAAEVLAAVRAVRDAGRIAILVTGRILSELRSDFPDVDGHFDAIVGENGAVFSRLGQGDRPLVEPVDLELYRAVLARGVHARRGQVILATDGAVEDIVNEEIRRLGLECQVERNRDALMVLPAGVTKGTGVIEALDELNLSPHSTVGVGDAENDHTLLSACEIGVAVGNAVAALKSHAEVTLETPNGSGVRAFLSEDFLKGLPGIQPARRCLTLGHYEDGTPATIPASRVNIVLNGPSGAGKSYVAGLLAEQLIRLRYSVCVIDVEGDHVPLGALHGVISLGAKGPLPPRDTVATLLAHGMRSVIVDLSLHPDEVKRSYARDLLATLHATRNETGIPHWLIVEEAHLLLPSGAEGWWCSDDTQVGICAITYRPDLLCLRLSAQSEYHVHLDQQFGGTLDGPDGRPGRRFVPLKGYVAHIRHRHKYEEGQLPANRRFYFRTRHGLTGHTAGNLSEFASEIASATAGVLRHHAPRNDFSRWLGDLWRDSALIEAVREIEAAIPDAEAGELLVLQHRLAEAVSSRVVPTLAELGGGLTGVLPTPRAPRPD
ncbi:MAG TPA: HAD hydrolase family protein [Gemmatimonadaceae bacterium]|nr:HAD hydrolase family protein [Gemmatimonadaceae bacterium]